MASGSLASEASERKEIGLEGVFWCHFKEHELYLVLTKKLPTKGLKETQYNQIYISKNWGGHYACANENYNAEMRKVKQEAIKAAKAKNKKKRDRYNRILKGGLTDLLV